MIARILIVILVVAGALLLGSDWVLHRHGHFSFEEMPGFYPAVAVISCFVVALGGAILRTLVGRKEGTYD